MPEKDPVEKWAEKNGIDGDMDSFCANEVICAFCLLITSKRASSLLAGKKCRYFISAGNVS